MQCRHGLMAGCATLRTLARRGAGWRRADTMAQRKVLITGATGYIAGRLLPGLRDKYDLTLVDIRGTTRDGTPVEGVRIADVLRDDLEQLRPLFKGQDSVIHLAFNTEPRPAPREGQLAAASAARNTYEAERANVDL